MLMQDRMLNSHEIARRAYDLYLLRGGQHGHDLEDWLRAERELRSFSTETELPRLELPTLELPTLVGQQLEPPPPTTKTPTRRPASRR
jgi:hypothetical protein